MNPSSPGKRAGRRPHAHHVRRLATAATLGLVGAGLAVTLPALAAGPASPITHSAPRAPLALNPIGTYETGVFDKSAAEIVAYHAATKRLFTVNAAAAIVEVLDVRRPSDPTKLFDLQTVGVTSDDGSVIGDGASANSVAVRPDGLGVIAVQNPVKTEPGWLVFFDARSRSGQALGAVRVGALPDMVTVSPDGRFAVVANEGEPADDYSADPEGSVGVVELPRRVAAPKQRAVRIADFRAYDRQPPKGVRLFGLPGPDGSWLLPSRNLEPEYVTVSGSTAYVSLQEANAIATVDLTRAKVTKIMPLGTKDHGLPQNALDPSDRDGAINIRTFPGLKGMYQPDTIASYRVRGTTYLVTANEGDAREWGDYVEPVRVKDLGKDGVPPICADSPLASLTGDADLGRLNVTRADGLRSDGSCYENLYSFGARSFSIWTTDGRLVFDSGSDLERITAAAAPEYFNAGHNNTTFDNRSDDKGPEPEAVTIGEVDGRTYAFIGLERVSGVAVYDITDPRKPTYVTYVNNRDFSVTDPEKNLSAAGDLGPESIAFIPAKESPTRRALIAVGNEVSGTTTLMDIRPTRSDRPCLPWWRDGHPWTAPWSRHGHR